MKAAWLIGSIVINLLLAPAVRADQCAYVTKAQAVAAFNQLSIGKTIYEFCELCGDKISKPILINSLSISNTTTPGYWQVMVNGQGIDLAYTYIDYGNNKPDGRRVNLALVANCSATNFTPILSISP
jgi:hypothetical protein